MPKLLAIAMLLVAAGVVVDGMIGSPKSGLFWNSLVHCEEDGFFKLIGSVKVTVPEDYDHATHLGRFRAKHGSKFYSYNNGITDENFARVTNQLRAGQEFIVEVFGITKPVTFEECLAMLRSKGAVLVGVQGISLAWEQNMDELPKGKRSVSFDEMEALWQDFNGNHRLPMIFAAIPSDFDFDLACFKSTLDPRYVVLCFRKKEPSDGLVV